MSETPKLLLEKDGPIGWIVFNQPQKKNAINGAMWRGIAPAMKQFEDIGVEVVVSNPSALSSELKQQGEFWGPLIERSGVKLD